MQRFSTLGRRDLDDNQAICTAGVSLCQHHDVKLRYSVAVDFVLGYDPPLYLQLVSDRCGLLGQECPAYSHAPQYGGTLVRGSGIGRAHWDATLRPSTSSHHSRRVCVTRHVSRPVPRVSQNWMNLCYSPETGRWAGESSDAGGQSHFWLRRCSRGLAEVPSQTRRSCPPQ